mmetsp:Transcript_19504/g.65468  ORF Transcript_19504/g.65468 Transcript_19504/m.65468 type:complete len:200 (+) Transcript_19504:1163-1762(+)
MPPSWLPTSFTLTVPVGPALGPAPCAAQAWTLAGEFALAVEKACRGPPPRGSPSRTTIVPDSANELLTAPSGGGRASGRTCMVPIPGVAAACCCRMRSTRSRSLSLSSSARAASRSRYDFRLSCMSSTRALSTRPWPEAPRVMNGWRMSASVSARCSGSFTRHLATKSLNSALHFAGSVSVGGGRVGITKMARSGNMSL